MSDQRPEDQALGQGQPARSKSPPRVGIQLASFPVGPVPDGGFYTSIARHAQRRGFEMLFVGDHIFAHNPMPEALSVLSYAAGAAPGMLLGTAVMILPLREPALLAKQVATIDRLSGGRLIFGVGVGGEMEHEWRALEVPTSDRGTRADEYLDILTALWSGEKIDHRGRYRSITGVAGTPGPTQTGGPPIWVGGRSDAALRRAARHAGWCAYAVSPRRMRHSVERLTELRRGDMGGFRVSHVLFTYVDDDPDKARAKAAHVLGRRYRQDFEVFLDAFCAVGTAEHVAERVDTYRSAGVDDVLLAPQAPADDMAEQLDRLADALTLAPVSDT